MTTERLRFTPYLRDTTPGIDLELCAVEQDRRTWHDEPQDILALRAEYDRTIAVRRRNPRTTLSPWAIKSSY